VRYATTPPEKRRDGGHGNRPLLIIAQIVFGVIRQWRCPKLTAAQPIPRQASLLMVSHISTHLVFSTLLQQDREFLIKCDAENSP